MRVEDLGVPEKYGNMGLVTKNSYEEYELYWSNIALYDEIINIR